MNVEALESLAAQWCEHAATLERFRAEGRADAAGAKLERVDGRK